MSSQKLINNIEDLTPIGMFYITIDNKSNAEKLARILLDQKLIACSNIVGNEQNSINSLYIWEGKIEKDNEILMIIKTRTSLLEEIVQTVQKNHPYKVPEIIGVPLFGGSQAYIQWVLENTKEPSSNNQ